MHCQRSINRIINYLWFARSIERDELHGVLVILEAHFVALTYCVTIMLPQTGCDFDALINVVHGEMRRNVAERFAEEIQSNKSR